MPLPGPLRPIRLVRPADLLVLDIGLTNLAVTADGAWLERVDNAVPALVSLTFPAQHVAERAYVEFEKSLEPVDPPPVGSLSSGPTRLVFALPDGQQQIAYSVAGLLGWAAMTPHLAGNALPPGAPGGTGPAPGVPGADRTAIELPYRLLLSPDGSARWEHREEPFAAGDRTELWHTRLAGDGPTVPVRAIGRRPVPDTLRTSLSDEDLDDLVTLSGDFSVRPKGYGQLGLTYGHWQQILQASGLVGHPFTPQPLDAEELMLTPLGASARIRGRFDYPSETQDPAWLRILGMPTPSLEQYEHVTGLGRDQFVRVVRRGFVHTGQRASLVKVTERRFEPRLLRTEQGPQGPYAVFAATAYLRQYVQVVIQEPVINFDGLRGGYAWGGREMPLRSLRLTTLVTPKIDLPGGIDPDEVERLARSSWIAGHPGQPVDEVAVAQAAQAALEGSLHQPFWIQVGGADLDFSFTATEWEGRAVGGSMPLVFVPYAQVGNAAAVAAEFLAGDAQRRQRPMGGQVVALADPASSAPASTSAPTDTLTFTLETVPDARLGALPADYRPHWLLAVSAASAHLEPVERLTGRGAAVDITLDPTYLAHGLGPDANPAGAFAALVTALPVALGGSGGGGVARPDATVAVVSSRQGALPASFATAAVAKVPGKPAIDTPALAAMFGNARLFGTISLSDVLAEIADLGPAQFGLADLSEETIAALLADAGARIEVPILRSRPLVRDGRPYAAETRYLWKPNLDAHDTIFSFGADSELVLDARTVTPLDGSEPQSQVSGELRSFGLSFAGVVGVQLDRLAFTALPGRKPDVTAEGLDMVFEGPLTFVNTLRDIIPAGGFSDPPSIEVTSEGISAGFSLGIPSVGVGVFSIQNLVLSAMLSVPFTERPAGVRFALSERHSPFLVTVTIFGGGGFFALGVSAAGVDEIEASIEFGGNVSLDLGVASGGVYVMAGVYFGMTGAATTLTGYLRCGGHLSVLGLISISLEFYLAFTWRDKGGGHSEIWGQASLSVCVKLVCFSKSVTLSIERRFAGASGDPTLDDVIDPGDWQDYCLAFAASEPV